MTKIRKKLDKLNTDFELQEILYNAIADWIENNKVDKTKYLQKYNDALITQENIE